MELKPGELSRKYTRRAKGFGENISDYRPAHIRGIRENGYTEKYNKKKVQREEKYKVFSFSFDFELDLYSALW